MLQDIKKYIFLLIPPVLVLVVNIYFRSFPVYFPQLKVKAREVLYKSIDKKIKQEVYAQFAQFNPIAKDNLIRKRVAEYKRVNARAIEQQIREGHRQLKEGFQDPTGQTYLMELDCWHWGRYVSNVLRLGHPGDRVENGKQRDDLMLAPLGSTLHWEHSLYYLSAFLYKVFSLFKKVPLYTFLFYLPLLFSAVFIILLYIFTYRYGGHLAAITSCVVVGLSPIFLQRSSAGWFDKDVLNLIFPLIIIWSYVSSINAQNFKTKIFWACISSFWVGLFCYTWTHWWLVPAIVIIYEAVFILSIALANFYLKEASLVSNLKERIISVSFFCVSAIFWVLVLCGPEPILILWSDLTKALVLNKPITASIWPNVYSTVGELKSMGIGKIAESLGGMSVFVMSILSIIALLITAVINPRYTGPRRDIIFILAIWTSAMLFASTRGIRFVMFLSFGLGISLGLAISEIYWYFRRKRIAPAVISVLIFFFVINGTVLERVYPVASDIYPLMNDTWYKILDIIREKTPEGTIINSWWDFGDWFKVVARRPVIFDGQSQDTPQAYWIAKAILSTDEKEAIAILRMLNNGGNRAFEIIDGYLKEPLKSVLLLESVIGKDPDKAQGILKDILPGPLVQEVMRLLYKTPARACFIVEDTMIPKMPAISYLGTWNFSKVYIARNVNKVGKGRIMEYLRGLGGNIEEIKRYYQEVFLIKAEDLDEWFSSEAVFYGGLTDGTESNGVVFFDNGFIYNLKLQSVRSIKGEVPRSLFVLRGNKLVEVSYANANTHFSILVVKGEGGYKCILLDRELANSIFVRLYFFKGAGLKYFSPFINAESGNNYIRVFNINW